MIKASANPIKKINVRKTREFWMGIGALSWLAILIFVGCTFLEKV